MAIGFLKLLSQTTQIMSSKKTIKTITISAMVAINDGEEKSMNFVQVMPDYPQSGMVTPFCGRGTAQMLSDGHFVFTRKPRKHNTPVLKLPHGSLSWGNDGYDRFTFVLPALRRQEFSRLLQEEAELAINFMLGLI